MENENAPELTILMPCRDEEAAVGLCVDEALRFLASRQLRGEVLVVDNASRDRSAEVARAHGARVVREERPGYGSALRAGLRESRGEVIVLGDCDTTYDFSQTGALFGPLSAGEYDVMIGDRFSGGIERGAMPLSHRAGVWALSLLGRLRYGTTVRDFHCGLRGLTREALEKMTLRCDGMEFATEFIAAACAQALRIGQAPVRLRRCALDRKSKLRTLRDGWRHLRFLLSVPVKQYRQS